MFQSALYARYWKGVDICAEARFTNILLQVSDAGGGAEAFKFPLSPRILRQLILIGYIIYNEEFMFAG